jgi:hypothetical protein
MHHKIQIATCNAVGEIGITTLCVCSDAKSIFIDWIGRSGNYRFVNSGLSTYIEACLATADNSSDTTVRLDTAFDNSATVPLPTFAWPSLPLPASFTLGFTPPTDDDVQRNLASVRKLIGSDYSDVSGNGMKIVCAQLARDETRQTATQLAKSSDCVTRLTELASGNGTSEQATMGCIILRHILEAVPSTVISADDLCKLRQSDVDNKWMQCEWDLYSYYRNALYMTAKTRV